MARSSTGAAPRTASVSTCDGLTAAHKSLPIPSYARVTNLSNGRSVVVRINDRGPYVHGRMLDVSKRVAELLRFHGGLERVRLDYLGKAGPAGAADERALLASLKTGDEPVAVARPRRSPRTKRASRSPSAARPRWPMRDQRPSAPAAAALAAAVRPPPEPAPLSVAATLDASARQLEAALEVAHRNRRARREIAFALWRAGARAVQAADRGVALSERRNLRFSRAFRRARQA